LTAYSSRRYLFSHRQQDRVETATRDAIDDCVVLLGARGVPISPELTQVISRPNGTSLKLTWSDEQFIRSGYRVYASTDGVSFGAPIDIASDVHAYTESGLAPGTKRYYKVTVVGAEASVLPHLRRPGRRQRGC
jgi:fibronectin type 3 domain-containing protein